MGIHFKAVTDCSAVRATMVKRDLVSRVARWWLALQECDVEIEYRPGQKMQHVDALSRNPVLVRMVNIGDGDWFFTVQVQDQKAQEIVAQLQDNKADDDCIGKPLQVHDCLSLPCQSSISCGSTMMTSDIRDSKGVWN